MILEGDKFNGIMVLKFPIVCSPSHSQELDHKPKPSPTDNPPEGVETHGDVQMMAFH